MEATAGRIFEVQDYSDAQCSKQRLPSFGALRQRFGESEAQKAATGLLARILRCAITT